MSLAYDLFRKLTKDDPEIQLDRIVTDMHTKNPWLDLGVLSIMVSARDRANRWLIALNSINLLYCM
jgi:hypothetical protein